MANRIEATEEERRARRAKQQADYAKRATRAIFLKLNNNTDADILEELDRQASKQGYIKKLIRDDMARRAAGE